MEEQSLPKKNENVSNNQSNFNKKTTNITSTKLTYSFAWLVRLLKNAKGHKICGLTKPNIPARGVNKKFTDKKQSLHSLENQF
jgi:hypothetical protein